MRYRVEAQDAAALIEGGGKGRLAVDGSRQAEVIGTWMNELRPGDIESGRAGPGVDCLFYVVLGLAHVVIEGRGCDAAAGDSFVVPPNEAYSVANPGNSELRVLEMQLPRRLDRPEGYPDTCREDGPTRRTEE
jgi:glyoxylate utilization-related uncharacterized protein